MTNWTEEERGELEEKAAACAVCLLAQGLPWTLRDYARNAGGMLQ